MFLDDLWNLEPTMTCSYILPKFQHFWKEKKDNIKENYHLGDDTEINPQKEVRISAVLIQSFILIYFNPISNVWW